jgi:uroporphyrin-3 C-methyltransferase
MKKQKKIVTDKKVATEDKTAIDNSTTDMPNDTATSDTNSNEPVVKQVDDTLNNQTDIQEAKVTDKDNNETIVLGKKSDNTDDAVIDANIEPTPNDAAIAPELISPENEPEQTLADDIKKNAKLTKIAIAISVVAIVISSAHIYYDFNKGTSNLDGKIADLEQLINNATANADSAKAAATSAAGNLTKITNDISALQSAETEKANEINDLQDRLTKSIQQAEAAGLKNNSRKDWLLAEVEYLLRLANQRVLMEKTPIGALALLESADKILQQTDDVSIFSVRKALAADIAALSVVHNIDQEGLYLKLDALNEQINNLKLVPVTDKKKLPQILDDVASDAAQANESNMAKIWDKMSSKLAKLVVISHRDSAIEPLLSPAQQAGLLQNLHILFEQAQLALLQSKQAPYLKSLEKAQLIINTYFQANDGTTKGLLKGLQELQQETISVELPSIAGSLNTLKSYLKQGTALKSATLTDNAKKGAAN